MRATNFAGALTLALSARSTGVVPMDHGTYMVSIRSAGLGMVSGDGSKADAYKEATAFCEAKGQDLETINVDVKDGRVFVRGAGASLEFRCVARSTAPSASASQ